MKGLILLDRDGVLNKLIVDPEHGTIDSPLHPDQVEIYSDAGEAAQRLNALGYGLVICTNQPSAAKGKTTKQNLEHTHAAVVRAIESRGARILSSHICFHRAEDACGCRKPATGLLEEAFAKNPGFSREHSWMVGDGMGDLKAGSRLGLKTAFLGPDKPEYLKVFEEHGVRPDLWCKNLLEFSKKVRTYDK